MSDSDSTLTKETTTRSILYLLWKGKIYAKCYKCNSYLTFFNFYNGHCNNCGNLDQDSIILVDLSSAEEFAEEFE